MTREQAVRRTAGRAGAPRSRFAALAGVLLMGGALAVSGCGGTQPMKSLSSAQQTQLNTVWSAVISTTDSATLDPQVREQRASALHQACRSLDHSNALLAALSDACSPIYVTEKLAAVLPGRCATPTATCSRALDRIATGTDDLAAKLANLGAQAKLVIKDPACAGEFETDSAKAAAYGQLTAAYRVVSLGVEQKQKDIATLGQNRISDAQAVVRDKRSVQARIAAFHKNCKLPG